MDRSGVVKVQGLRTPVLALLTHRCVLCGLGCTQVGSRLAVARWPQQLHIGKERPLSLYDQSSQIHFDDWMLGPRSTQRRHSDQGPDWLRPSSSLGACHELKVGKAGFPNEK